MLFVIRVIIICFVTFFLYLFPIDGFPMFRSSRLSITFYRIIVINDGARPGGSNFKVMRRAEGAENFLDYLRCYICLKSCKCKLKEESKYYNISYYCS